MRKLMVSLALSRRLVLGTTFFRTTRKVLFLLICAMLLASTASAATYYISNALGSDTNTSTQAQSKATPWKHAPGMFSCAANCLALYNGAGLQPGDRVILRGGDIWHNGDMNIVWRGSGTAAAVIYFGVDTTWFSTAATANSVNCGTSFCRPIFSGDGITVSNPRDGTGNQFIAFFDAAQAWQFVQVDNIEFTGLFWTGNPMFNNYIHLGLATNIHITNCYFHGWSHGPSPGTNDALTIIRGSTNPPYNQGSFIENSVFDGSFAAGGDQASGSACYFCGPEVRKSTFRYLPNNIVGPINIHDNLIEFQVPSFGIGIHPNAIETWGAFTIYNNVIRHVPNGAGEAVLLEPNGGTSYVFNNVFWDLNVNGNNVGVGTNCDGAIPCNAGTSTVAFYNNTIEVADGTECLALGNGSSTVLGTLITQNNHCINAFNGTSTDGFLDAHNCVNGVSSCIGTWTRSNNVLQTEAVANAQGYVPGNNYAPASNTGATVGSGLNLTTSCSIVPTVGSLSALCGETTLGVGYNATTHTVIVPGRGPLLPRPVSGNWDRGAYSPRPNPPTGLAAVVN